MSNNEITGPQAHRIYQATLGYRDDAVHSFWISAQGLVYLTVYNVVYVIDRFGGYQTRAKRDGRGLGGGGPLPTSRTLKLAGEHDEAILGALDGAPEGPS